MFHTCLYVCTMFYIFLGGGGVVGGVGGDGVSLHALYFLFWGWWWGK